MTGDEQLVLRFQQARGTFSELCDGRRDPLCGFFRRRPNKPARAEELAQDYSLALLRNLAR